MRIEASRRRRKPSRRVPAAEMREQFQDGRVWARKAQVFKPDGGPHFYIHTDQRTGARKVMVEVTTVPEGEDLTCQLSTRPLWYIPPPGTIVYVGIPSGEIDHCPEIIGISDSGTADQDISEERTLLSTDKDFVLKVPSGKLGGADASEPLVLGNKWKDFAEAIIDAIVNHTHTCAGSGSPSGTPLNAATDFAPLKLNLADKLSQIMMTK